MQEQTHLLKTTTPPPLLSLNDSIFWQQTYFWLELVVSLKGRHKETDNENVGHFQVCCQLFAFVFWPKQAVNLF